MSVRRSFVWSFGGQAVSFFLTFASTLIVARIITPRDLGIFAMAGAITAVLSIFLQFYLSRLIMRSEDMSSDFLRSVFTVNLLLTLAYAGSIVIAAAVASSWGSHEVGKYLFVAAAWPLIAMFEFVPAALCARNMRFGVVSTLLIVKAVVLSSTTIALALLDFAYMSFAWAQVITGAVTAIGYNIAIWRPDIWRPHLAGARKIVRFGLEMVGVSGLGQLSVRAGEMTLGSLLGLTNLGLYARASGLPLNLYGNVIGAGSPVVFSRLASEIRDTGEIHGTYVHFMRLLLGLLWPMLIGIAVLAQPVVALLYGARWQAAAEPLALMTIAVAITLAISIASEVFILRHQTSRQTRIEVLRALFGYAAFAAGAMVSLTMAAAAKVAEAVFALLLYRKPLAELVGGPGGALGRVYGEAALVTVAAILPALMLMIWKDWSPATPLLHLIIAVALGVAAWALLLFRLRHPLYLECARLVIRGD